MLLCATEALSNTTVAVSTVTSTMEKFCATPIMKRA